MCHLGHRSYRGRAQGTASFANVQVVASIRKADAREAVLPPPNRRAACGLPSSVFRESSIRPDSCVPGRAAARSKRCPERAEGRCSAALGVERHMDVPRSRTEAGRRRERRPPVRHNSGPFRSRRKTTLTISIQLRPVPLSGEKPRKKGRRESCATRLIPSAPFFFPLTAARRCAAPSGTSRPRTDSACGSSTGSRASRRSAPGAAGR